MHFAQDSAAFCVGARICARHGGGQTCRLPRRRAAPTLGAGTCANLLGSYLGGYPMIHGVSSIPTAAGFRPIFRRSFEHGIAKVS